MQHLNTLMQKEMSRKEFLAAISLGVASIFGFSAILKMLFGKGEQNHTAQAGYGSSAYGGSKRAV